MERRLSHLLLFGSLFLFALFMLACQQEPRPADTGGAPLNLSELMLDKDLQSLGRKIFFDDNLSTPPGQACAACHSPDVGWTGPDEELNKRGSVYPGAVHTRFGNRKPNASAYATLTPSFHALRKGEEVVFVGGDFWDGRATGWKLGNPAADQAQGPFLNPVEQNNAGAKAVLDNLRPVTPPATISAMYQRPPRCAYSNSEDLCFFSTQPILSRTPLHLRRH